MVLHGIVLLASARAVSRKTPTYFMVLATSVLATELCNGFSLSAFLLAPTGALVVVSFHYLELLFLIAISLCKIVIGTMQLTAAVNGHCVQLTLVAFVWLFSTVQCVQIMDVVSEDRLNQNCPINTELQAWPGLPLTMLQTNIFTT